MAIALLVLVFIAMAAIEIPPLWREKSWREVTVFGVIWVLALALDSALALGVKLPNPTEGIERVVAPIQHFLFGG